MRIGFILIIALCSLPLLSLNLSTCKGSIGRTDMNNSGKLSDELKTAISNLHPNDTCFTFLDLSTPSLSNGNPDLSTSDLLPITTAGVKIAGITFSPDEKTLWCLAEASADQLKSVIDLSIVRNASLAPVGTWDWWSKPWYKETNIDPILEVAANRMTRDFPGEKIEVVINYALDQANHSKECKQRIVDGITADVNAIGGDVEKVGLAEYVLAKVPPTMLTILVGDASVRTLEAVKPAAARDSSLRESTNGNPSLLPVLFLLFLPPLLACQLVRKPQKRKSMLVVFLLLSSFLFSTIIPSAYSLSVSRRVIEADKLGQDGRGITVAVIDHGIDLTHPDLANAIIASQDFTGNNDPTDRYGHGTHVAGIIASRSQVYMGIAPAASLIDLKIGILENQIRDALQWCIDNKANFNIRVIHMSVGAATEQPGGDGMDSLSMKADEAVDNDMVVVVAIMDHDTNGDGKYQLSNPEQAFNVIAVGSINDGNTVPITDDTLASYSSHGPTGDGRPKPDVVAPGGHSENPLVGIWSTRSMLAAGSYYEAVDGLYGCKSGTSMAAPHVSGTVALMLQQHPNLTPAQVKAVLRQTARLNSNLNGLTLNDRGHGIIDAFDAVLAVNMGDIHTDQMYDSWVASTPGRDLGYGYYDYLTFAVSPPSTQGISMENIAYHQKWYVIPIADYKLVQQAYTRDVWIDGTYYNLGADMGKYLLSGPRVYEKGGGYFRLQAWYKIGTVSIRYDWFMHVNAQTFEVEYSGGSSWQTLTYLHPGLYDTTNYAFLPSNSQTILIESKMTDQPIDIRVLGRGEYVQIYPENSATMWVLKHGYVGNNPDDAKNDEYIYNRDVDIYYQTSSQWPAVTTWRRTDQLPGPSNAQNDAGSGGDAGNSFGYAAYINPGSYTGILCNSDPSDTQDWYAFYVDSRHTAIVYMSPPPGIDFDLELYDPSYQLRSSSHNGPGIPEAVGYDNCQAGWWRARIFTINGEAQYSFSVSISEGGAPYGCPFVFAWNGQRYVEDNNLLPTSLKSNGTDVEDYYKLEQPLVTTYRSPFFSLYKLQISEFENEHSYIDQVRLLAVDHSVDCNVAVTPDGDIVTYRQPQPPVSCGDNNGTNRISQTQLIDGNVSDPSTYFDGYIGDYLIVNFGKITSQNAKLILRDDRKCQNIDYGCCIEVQVMNKTGWQTISVVAPREYWATEAVNLSSYIVSGQDLTVRLYWTMPHRLDYVGLDTTWQERLEIHYAQLVSAMHSADGNVLGKLLRDDDVYAELVPGQQTQLTFLMPNNQNQNEERTFIFYTEGHYNTIS